MVYQVFKALLFRNKSTSVLQSFEKYGAKRPAHLISTKSFIETGLKYCPPGLEHSLDTDIRGNSGSKIAMIVSKSRESR